MSIPLAIVGVWALGGPECRIFHWDAFKPLWVFCIVVGFWSLWRI